MGAALVAVLAAKSDSIALVLVPDHALSGGSFADLFSVKGKGDVVAYDADSASVIKLSNNYVLYLREVNK